MKELKEKPKMGKVKEKPNSALMPKQAVHMMKEKYIKELDQRPKGAENDGQQAPDQVERAGRWAADELTGRAMEQGREYAKKKFAAARGKAQAAPDATPSAQGTPGDQSASEPPAAPGESRTAERSPTAPKERPQAEYAANPIKDRQMVEHRAATQGQPRPYHTGAVPYSEQAPAHNGAFPFKERPLTQAPGEGRAADMPRAAPPRTATGYPSAVSDKRPDAVPPSARQQMLFKERPRLDLQERRVSPFSPSAPAHGNHVPKGAKASPAPKVRRGVFKLQNKRYVRPAASTARAARVTRQRMQRQLFTQVKQPAAKGARAAFKRAVQAVVKAAAAVTGTVSAVVGGSVLLVALVIIIVIAAVANSPFGLFFAQEPNAPNTVSVAQAVGSVNMAFNTRLELLQSGDYDSIDIQGAAPDWPDVLAVFAVKTAGADVGGMDVATLDPDRVARLTTVFWDMTTPTATVEIVTHPDSDPDDEIDDSWVERKLHITITSKTADDMRTAYALTDYQNNALDELLADRTALASLAGSLSITSADVLEVLQALPDNLSPERKAVVEKALSLVGKVNYFWGGKSYVIGWDSRWGTLRKVTSPGNDTSGTYRPYGLDCSGFLDWALRNAGLHSDGHWYIGRNLVAVSQENAIPGDFALYPDASHVGMIVGRNAAGKLLVCHCSSGMNNVVVTEFSASGFTAVGRQALRRTE